MAAVMAGMPGPYGPAPTYPPNYPNYPATYPPPMPYGPYAPPPAGFWAHVTNRQKAGLVVGIVGLVLGILAAFGPFWTFTISATQLGISISISLNIGMLGASFSNIFIPLTPTYDQTPFLLAGVMVLVGILLGVLSLVFGLRSGPTAPRKLGPALAAAGGALMIVAPIYLVFSAPSALSQLFGGGAPFPAPTSFWGSQTISSGGISILLSWGAGWAWYLAFIAAALIIVGGVLAASRAPAAVMGPAPSSGFAPGTMPNPWAPVQPQTPASPPQNPGAPPM